MYNICAMNNFGTIIILVVVIVAILAYICLTNWFKSKKAEEHYREMLTQIKVGSKIKTLSGIYGEITKIVDMYGVKVVTIKLADGALMEIDSKAIYGLDERGNKLPINETAAKPHVLESEPKAEQKPATKTTVKRK